MAHIPYPYVNQWANVRISGNNANIDYYTDADKMCITLSNLVLSSLIQSHHAGSHFATHRNIRIAVADGGSVIFQMKCIVILCVVVEMDRPLRVSLDSTLLTAL